MPSNSERFRRAAAVLVGPGTAKQRLTEAFLAHLRDVDTELLPADVHQRYTELTASLTCLKATVGLNAVEATVRKMSEPEAGRHAERVIEMLVAMAGSDSREPAVSSRQLRLVSDDDEIPAFLNRA